MILANEYGDRQTGFQELLANVRRIRRKGSERCYCGMFVFGQDGDIKKCEVQQ